MGGKMVALGLIGTMYPPARLASQSHAFLTARSRHLVLTMYITEERGGKIK